MVDYKQQSIDTEAEINVVSPVGAQPSAKSNPQAVPKSHRKKVAWQALGTLFAVIAGFLCNRFWGWDIFSPGSENFFFLVGIEIFLLVCSGVFLVRSLWALVIVPVAWLVGVVLGDTLIPLILISICALTLNSGG